MPVTALVLKLNRVNTSSTHREPAIGQGTAPPTVGHWIPGDVILNTAIAVGSPTGWICTELGYPGLWTTLPEVVS